MTDLQQKIQDYFDWLRGLYDESNREASSPDADGATVGWRDGLECAFYEFKEQFDVKETK